MSILVDKNTKVIVQGLTGKTGTFHTEQALAYHGTQMVAGVHPKKGGEEWVGSKGEKLPIFASVAEAKKRLARTLRSSMCRRRALALPSLRRSRRKYPSSSASPRASL
jgi:succinyl-CoA synthetase alpha subunit